MHATFLVTSCLAELCLMDVLKNAVAPCLNKTKSAISKEKGKNKYWETDGLFHSHFAKKVNSI